MLGPNLIIWRHSELTGSLRTSKEDGRARVPRQASAPRWSRNSEVPWSTHPS